MIDPSSFAPALPAVAATLISTTALLVSEYRENAVGRAIFKTVASLGFVGLALNEARLETAFGLCITVGLCLSLAGDLALLVRGAGRAFYIGIGLFLLAHLAYLCAFFAVEQNLLWAGGLLIVLAPVARRLHRWLAADIHSKLKVAVTAYIVVITAMVCVAFSTSVSVMSLVMLAPTALLFMVSDIGVAAQRFKGAGFQTKLWATPAYFVAQLSFALHTMIDF
jgi:uncharacterized membrane protein YhhN